MQSVDTSIDQRRLQPSTAYASNLNLFSRNKCSFVETYFFKYYEELDTFIQ